MIQPKSQLILFMLMVLGVTEAGATSLSLFRAPTSQPTKGSIPIKPTAADLILQIQNLFLPDTIMKELTSGLSNRWFLQIQLKSNSLTIQTIHILLSLRYDLWDEVFHLNLVLGGQELNKWSFKSRDELLQFLQSFKIRPAFLPNTLKPTDAVGLEGTLHINPITKEKLDKIQEWVQQNSQSVPTTSAGLPNGTAPTALRTNVLFNKIFEEYQRGSAVAAGWTENLKTPSLHFSEVPYEK